jgi:hypothetical protein
MKRSYRILTGKATSKSVAEQAAGLAALQGWAKHSLEQLSATMGLKMLDLMLSAEIQERTGERGQQVAYRHGHQPGYVVWGGRKVAVHRPRLRAKEGGELPLETYQRFQQDGAWQRALVPDDGLVFSSLTEAPRDGESESRQADRSPRMMGRRAGT